MGTWNFGFATWIVQDGNYADFERGRRAEFAVELERDAALQPAGAAAPSARALGGARYAIVGRVETVLPETWVIDFGIPVYTFADQPAGVRPGSAVTGEVTLAVDPFSYFEQLAPMPEMPPLVLSWEIAAIKRSAGAGGWVDCDRTDGWGDDGAEAEYLFECTLRDDPPKRTSADAVMP